MLTIDADAHVIENESTWEHMLESERRFRPTVEWDAQSGGRPEENDLRIVSFRFSVASNSDRPTQLRPVLPIIS